MDAINTENQDVVTEETASETTEAQTALSLDSVNEFEFQGQKFTPEAFHEVLNEYNELKSGRDSYAKNAHFYSNLPYDLETVAIDPKRAEDFKSAYPEAFHKYLDVVLRTGKAIEKTPAQNVSASIPPEVQKRMDELEAKLMRVSSHVEKTESSASLQEVNSVVDPLLSKYPLAVEETVLLEAEALAQKGYKVTPQVWEKLIKNNHELIEKRSTEYYRNKLKQKSEQSKKAKDSGAGGSAVGSGTARARTFDQATELAIKELNRG